MSSSNVTISLDSQKSINSALAGTENAVVFAEDGTPKLLTSLSSPPDSVQLKSDASGANNRSVVIGSSEAKMMKDNKLFTNDGDTTKDLFGNNVIVYTLPETNTLLDKNHFVDASFVVAE